MCIFLVPKDYQTAYFLNENDKTVMKHRAEATQSYSGGSGHTSSEDMKLAAKDIKSWLHGIIQICVVTVLYGRYFHCICRDFCLIKIRVRYFPANHNQGWIQILYSRGPILGHSR